MSRTVAPTREKGREGVIEGRGEEEREEGTGRGREREGEGEKELCHQSWRQLAEIPRVVY